MTKSCVLIPRVKTPTGEMKDSKLFKDLLSFTNRDRNAAVRIYAALKDKSNLEGRKLEYDDNGEPTVESILKNTYLKNLLDDTTVISAIEMEIGASDKTGKPIILEDTYSNYKELSERVDEFNRTSRFKDSYVAIINTNNGNCNIHIERKNESNSLIAKKIHASLLLNEKIRLVLGNSGISIEYLEDLQNALGIVDYENAKITADGFISLIKILNGSKGEKALPEEFAHFVIDTMSEDPMIQRLMSLMNREDVIREALGEEYNSYMEDYNDDTQRLRREAAGKYLYKALVGEIKSTHTTFLRRVIDSIKRFFSRLTTSSITDAIAQAEASALEISGMILSRDRIDNVNFDKIKTLSNLKQINNSNEKLKGVLLKSINNELKKHLIYVQSLQRKISQATDDTAREQLKTKLQNFQERIQSYISSQQINLDADRYNEGVIEAINYYSEELSKVVNRMGIIDSYSLSDKAYQLREIKNFIDSALPVITSIIESESEGDFVLDLAVKNNLEKLNSIILQLKTRYNAHTLNTFGAFLKEYLPEDGINIESDGKSRKITRDDINDLLKTAERDLSVLDTWVQSASEADSIIIKLSDQALKAAKERKRAKVIDIRKRLLAVAKELKDSGVDNTDFMFEKHESGSLSRNYISEINYTLYEDREREMIKQLNETYGEVASGKNAIEKIRLKQQWYQNNLDVFKQPRKEIYGVDLESELTETQYKYYKLFKEIRDEMISYLPKNTYERHPQRAVQIRKDLWERIKSSSPDTWGRQILESSKDALLSRVDDDSFGTKMAFTDFNDRELWSVPIYFTRDVEDESELSRDTVSTILAFADMAVNYNEMLDVADYFELGRDVFENMKADIQKGDSPLKEKLKSLGIVVSSNVRKEASNLASRYNALLKTQLYGRYLDDSTLINGKDWEIKSTKAARFLNKWSSLNQLALNGLAAIAAAGNDIININSEALAGQYFNASHLRRADSIYLKEIAGVIGEMQNPIKKNKLSLFIEMFDVTNDYENDIRDIEWDKSRLKKTLSTNSLYFMMHSGAHWSNSRTALAQALNAEVTSDDGTETSNLWDILEVEYIDSSDESKGARLKVKDGYSLSQKDIKDYTRKFMGLNNRLFGIYNKADQNSLQNMAVGQLVFLYRKFLIPALNRRFGKVNFNLDLNEQTEGYYRSAYHFLRNLATDSRNLGRDIAMYWNEMSDNEKSNCVRAINELMSFVVLACITALLTHLDWDDKENPWYKRFMAYMSRRMKTEAGAFTPVGIFNETWNILKSPAAAISTLEGMADILDIVNPWNYEAVGGEDAVVQRGKYKGHNKAYKAFFESPFVPLNKTIYKMAHPEELIVAFR